MSKRFWKFLKGIILAPESTDPTDNVESSFWTNSGKLKGYLDSGTREILTDNQTQTISNKDIDGTNGNTISNVQFDNTDTPLDATIQQTAIKEINYIQQEDRSSYLKCVDNILWDGTSLSFTSDIILEIINSETGTITTHTILAANSPLDLSTNNTVYIDIDRSTSEDVTPVVSNTLPTKSQDVFVLFKRVTESGAANLYLPFSKQLVTEGKTFKLGASGSGGGLGIKVRAYDPVNTTLPSVDPVVLDGLTIVEDDLVLFSNLSSGGNRVYKASITGGVVSWTPERSFDSQFDPTAGDSVTIQEGDSFASQITIFDGSEFKINDTVRYFDGTSANYWEMSSIKRTNITNSSSGNIFTVALVGSENFIVDYSLLVGTAKETGQLFITSDGTNVSIIRHAANINDTQIEFSAIKNVTNLELNYTSSNATDGVMRYFTKRWSNSDGGPSGLPTYNAGTSSTTPAAGNTNEVQYKGSDGNLAASSEFIWDGTKGAISLDGLDIKKLSDAITLNDAQVSPTPVINYPSSNKYTVIEYSIERGGEERIGRVLIATNGTAINFSDDFVETSTQGITLSVSLNGTNVELLYTSTSTGNTGTFKYTFRQWT